MLGFLGGSSWQHVTHLASRIGLGALALFVLAFAGAWLLRRVRRRRGEPGSPAAAWVRTGQRLQVTRPGGWVTERFPVQVAFLGRRLDPFTRAGLPATVLLLAGVACAWTFGGLTEDVVAGDGLASADRSVHTWVVAHRVGWLNPVMRTVTWGGSNLVLVPAILLTALLLWRRRRGWRPVLLLAGVYAVAGVGHVVAAGAVHRPRPPVADWLSAATGWSYPSGHTTQAAAFCGALLLVIWPRSSPAIRTLALLGALVAVALVGASRVYLGVHWLTDVLGGLTLSTAVVLLAGAVTLGRDAGRRGAGGRGADQSPGVVEAGQPS
jgi:undecaprenyl-diphosphatase